MYSKHIKTFPMGTQRNNVIITSKQRLDILMTLLHRLSTGFAFARLPAQNIAFLDHHHENSTWQHNVLTQQSFLQSSYDRTKN